MIAKPTSFATIGADKNETMIMAFDHKDATATSEFDSALHMLGEDQGSYRLLQSHIGLCILIIFY